MSPKTPQSHDGVTWQAVKATCSPADMERLACLGLIYIKTGQTNKQTYIEMATEIGGTTKPESHRRVLDMLVKKIREGGNGEGATPGKKGGGGGRKRKMVDVPESDDEEVETPKGKKGRVKVEKGVEEDEADGEMFT